MRVREPAHQSECKPKCKPKCKRAWQQGQPHPTWLTPTKGRSKSSPIPICDRGRQKGHKPRNDPETDAGDGPGCQTCHYEVRETFHDEIPPETGPSHDSSD
jgi:hypothetical protein